MTMPKSKLESKNKPSLYFWVLEGVKFDSSVMRIFRKIFKIILPKSYFNKIEEESKKWFLVCPCGFKESFWEAGGLRAWAIVNKPVMRRCSMCKRIRIMRLVKKKL